MNGESQGFFQALPFAAWTTDDADADRLRCNRRAAALLGDAGMESLTLAELQASFEFEDGGSFALQLAALPAGRGERRFGARLVRAPCTEMTFSACAIDGGARAAVALFAWTAADRASFPHGDWWQRLRHDLRGPITPVRMALQMMQSGRVRVDQVAETLALADRQIDQLLAVIDDMSDLLGVHAGRFSLRRVDIDLRQLVGTLGDLDHVTRTLGDAGHVLECVMPSAAVPVAADPQRLPQLLEYLLYRVAGHAPAGAAIRLELEAGAAHARLRIGGAGPELADDAALAWVVAGPAADVDPSRLDMRSLLMREVASRQGVVFASVERGRIEMRLPLASPLALPADPPMAAGAT